MKCFIIFMITWALVASFSLENKEADPAQNNSIAQDENEADEANQCWHKLNNQVCFGAKNSQFGRLYIPMGGQLAAIKLIHTSGQVTCDTRHASYSSNWGCGTISDRQGTLNIVITTSANLALLPLDQFIVRQEGRWSRVPGYTPYSREVVLLFSNPHSVHENQELRLWYGEDLMNSYESDNGGRVCCEIYFLYI